MRLTNKTIKSFKYEGGWDVRWDDTVPGFGLRIYPSGKKSFVLSYRSDGRKRLIVLGRFGADLTIEQARDRARNLRVEVREGADPFEERRRAGQGNTLGDLIDAYLERHASQKRTGRADERRLKRNIPTSWRSRRASAIKRAEIAELHHKFGLRAPYEANRLLEVLRKMFNLGQVWGYVDEGHPNPAVGIDKFKEIKRVRDAYSNSNQFVTPIYLSLAPTQLPLEGALIRSSVTKGRACDVIRKPPRQSVTCQRVRGVAR